MTKVQATTFLECPESERSCQLARASNPTIRRLQRRNAQSSKTWGNKEKPTTAPLACYICRLPTNYYDAVLLECLISVTFAEALIIISVQFPEQNMFEENT